MELLVDLEECG